MSTLYVASTETFVGKSAVCIGLLDRMQRDGFRIGYMKPVSVSVMHTEAAVLDEDAAFVRKTFGLAESLETMAPVLVTAGMIEGLLRGQAPDYTRRVRDAYIVVSRDKDVVLLEGTNTWSEGTLLGLSADQVSDMLAAPGLLVMRYRSTLSVDTILAVQRFIGERLCGVVLNQIEDPQVDFVNSRVRPFLEHRNIPVFAMLPQDQQLAGVTVAELHETLGGRLISQPALVDRLVETLMIGAMGAESALSHFRRRENKAVITGGDRTDLQLAALETSTAVLVLTGNINPTPLVVDRAEECQVPIILVPDETLATVERAEGIFGRLRFRQAAKLQRFKALMDERFDYQRLYDAIGLPVM